MQIPISAESRILFNPLTLVAEPGTQAAVLGCTLARRFVEVNEETVHAILAIQATKSLAEAEVLLKEKHGIEADCVDFAREMRARGFLKEIDGRPASTEEAAQERHPYLHAIPPRLLRWIHADLVWVAAVAVLSAWVGLVVRYPEFLPSVNSLNIVSHPSLTLSISFGGALLLSYIHELAHFFTARSYGIEATINISHRFFIPVLQTDVTNAWVLPVSSRVKIFLAGIMFNLLAMACATFAVAGHHAGVHLPSGSVAWLEFFAYLNFFPLIFQLFITSRTDLYHAAMALTRQRNLYADSKNYLMQQGRRTWDSILRQPKQPCPNCSASTHPKDPFCTSCGAIVDRNSAMGRVSKDNRWIFWTFGVFLVAGAMVGYWFLYQLVVRFVLVWLGLGYDFLAEGVATRNLWKTIDGAVAVFFALVKLSFVAYMVGQAVERAFPKPAQFLRYKAAKTRAYLGKLTASKSPGDSHD